MTDQYQIQIVLVKRVFDDNTARFHFEEVTRTDPVYVAEDQQHSEAVMATIKRYGESL